MIEYHDHVHQFKIGTREMIEYLDHVHPIQIGTREMIEYQGVNVRVLFKFNMQSYKTLKIYLFFCTKLKAHKNFKYLIFLFFLRNFVLHII